MKTIQIEVIDNARKADPNLPVGIYYCEETNEAVVQGFPMDAPFVYIMDDSFRYTASEAKNVGAPEAPATTGMVELSQVIELAKVIKQ